MNMNSLFCMQLKKENFFIDFYKYFYIALFCDALLVIVHIVFIFSSLKNLF